MNSLIKEKDNILSFTLFKVEKGREKICKCHPPHYEIDTVNRIVSCRDCGATVDSFEALLNVAEYADDFVKYQRKAIETIKTQSEFADKEFHRRMRYRAFKEMDKQYQNDLLPICPRCGRAFEPMEIRQYVNRKYADLGESEDT